MPNHSSNIPTELCSVDGCESVRVARGWCAMHYQRWKAHGDPLWIPFSGRQRAEVCSTCSGKLGAERPEHLGSRCRDCRNLASRESVAKHPRKHPNRYVRSDEQKRYNNEYQKRRWASATAEQRAHRIELNRKRNKALRAEVMSGYGGGCVCCGESEDAFLTLDHVNNDGKQHRQELGTGKGSATDRLYRWARNNGFPASLQILCWNCNLAKQLRGECPHERMRREQTGAH